MSVTQHVRIETRCSFLLTVPFHFMIHVIASECDQVMIASTLLEKGNATMNRLALLTTVYLRINWRT